MSGIGVGAQNSYLGVPAELSPGIMRMNPNKILLATDLSCRCDRALDRAAALASEWNASLTAVHAQALPDPVTEDPSWRQPPEREALARRRILADLRGAENLRLEVLVERGQPASVVLDVAERLGAELIVAGVPREETLIRAILGSTIGALARKSKAPLLVAKSRPRGAYRNVVVATDFSEGSSSALETALKFFPEADITLFHAYHVTFDGLADDKMAVRHAAASRAMDEARAFVARVPAAASHPGLPVLCEHGDIGAVLGALVDEREVDLVILGARGHSRLVDLLLGSVAQRLIMELPADVLISRPR